MAILPNLEVVNHLITRFRGSFPSRGSLVSAAGGYIARYGVYRKRIAYIARLAHIALSPSQSACADSSPEGEPLRENGFRQALPGESSHEVGERGILRTADSRPYNPTQESALNQGSPWGELPRKRVRGGKLRR